MSYQEMLAHLPMFSCDPKQAVGISRLPWQAVDTPQVQHLFFPVFEGDKKGAQLNFWSLAATST